MGGFARRSVIRFQAWRRARLFGFAWLPGGSEKDFVLPLVQTLLAGVGLIYGLNVSACEPSARVLILRGFLSVCE